MENKIEARATGYPFGCQTTGADTPLPFGERLAGTSLFHDQLGGFPKDMFDDLLKRFGDESECAETSSSPDNGSAAVPGIPLDADATFMPKDDKAQPVNLVDPHKQWGINFGGSLMGMDFSATLYDSQKGWFPSTSTDMGVSTTAFGGGIQITFDTGVESRTSPCEDVNVSMGMGKYLGATYNTELSRGSINLGLGLGLPVSFSTPVQNFAQGLNNSLQRVFE
jgi:hypothetical protein